MREKITLEQFDYYRNKLESIINNTTANYEAASHEYDFDNELYFKRYRREYEEVQKELFSYDLSGIPYKKWEGYTFITEDPRLDISGSKANIDFNIVNIDNKEISLKAHDCNIINLGNSGIRINEDNFDSKVIESMFIDKNKIPDNVLSDFYNRRMELKEILEYGEYFSGLNFDNYYSEPSLKNLVRLLPKGELQEAIFKNKSYFLNNLDTFGDVLETTADRVINLKKLHSKIAASSLMREEILKGFFKEYNNDFSDNKEIPKWIYDMDCHIVGMVNSEKEFLDLPTDTIVLDRNLKHACIYYGLENLQRFARETGMLNKNTNGFSDDMTLLRLIDDQIANSNFVNVNFNDYSAFLANIANLLNTMRGQNVFRGNNESAYAYFSGNFREKFNNMFISEDAPYELRRLFYGGCISAIDLKNNPEWIPFLKGKDLSQSLKTGLAERYKLKNYFTLLGFNDGLKLYMSKPVTIDHMVAGNSNMLIKDWYLKTGKKFIPDYTVMQNFPFEKSDKFLANGKKWTHFMKAKRYSDYPEGRVALLKLAYSFGVFDEDQMGIKKLESLLMDLPRKLNEMDIMVLNSALKENDKEDLMFNFNNPIKGKYFNIISALQKEGFPYDPEKNIFEQIYRFNSDGTANLAFSEQDYPDSSELIRDYLEEIGVKSAINYADAYRLFGDFNMEYNPKFREFLLDNLNTIIENPQYVEYVSKIQKRFKEISRVNSNRQLTLELAINYVEKNKFDHVNLGNERLSNVASIAGYSQNYFDTLQKIYNYGKVRTFNSIPKINNKYQGYHYETLDLDDPLALAIGTLTNCCQELNDTAEMCMEHSMVDNHGRVFIIKDKDDNIVAQSWMWRNQNIICFDNIEVPKKVIDRAEDTVRLTDEIYNVYKQVAHEMIELDKAKYLELYSSGKISKDQYENLRLGKVTVGEGYNDVLSAIERNSVRDDESARPLHFEPVVPLTRELYINDSRKQYVLDNDDYHSSTKYVETLPIYSDRFMEYDDSNFNEKDLLKLQKLELITEKSDKDLQTKVNDTSSNIISKLAENYHANPDNTRIIMNPNLAIIYEIKDDGIRVKDLLYNTKIDNRDQQIDITSEVAMQINLAFEQLSSYGNISITELDKSKLNMYDMAMREERDFYRGGDRYAK